MPLYSLPKDNTPFARYLFVQFFCAPSDVYVGIDIFCTRSASRAVAAVTTLHYQKVEQCFLSVCINLDEGRDIQCRGY